MKIKKQDRHKAVSFIINVLFLLFFLTPTVSSFAQRQQIDSLKNVLPTLKDSARIDCINALSNSYIWVKTDSAKLLATQAMEEAETLHYIKGMANSYNNLAWITRLMADNYPQMEMYCKKVIALLEKTGEKEQLPYSWVLMGFALAAQGKFSLSLIAFEKGCQGYLAIGDELGLANTYAFMADAEKNRGHYEKSLEYSVKWLDISEKVNNKRYLDIWASLYKNIGDYETAIDYYNQAAQYARETQHFDELGWFIQSIGEIFFLQGKYDSARHYYDLALHYNPNNQLESRKGELYIAFKKYDSGLECLNKAINKAIKANALNQEMWILLRLGKAYKEVGNNRKALQTTHELLQKAQETEARQYIRDAHFLLYELFAKSRKLDSSFTHLQKYIALKDTIDKDLSAQKLAFYQIRSEKEKNQSRINLLNEEKKLQQQQLNETAQQRKFLIAGIAALCLIGITLFRNLFLKQKNEKQRMEHELEIQKTNERLRISRELHDDIGGTLSGIVLYSHLAQNQVVTQNAGEAKNSLNIIQQSANDMVNRLNDIVWSINPGHNSLKNLIQKLEEYAREMAIAKNIKVQVNAAECLAQIQLPVESCHNIYLFGKEAITNAIKYSRASLLELSAYPQGDIIELTIKDNGQGFDIATVTKGNGLINMQKRADEVGAMLSLQSIPQQGTFISLKCKIT